ncbi:hypothetical protein [Streptomyces edwardsiae]|uniref:Integral membrane protein n=1 Tax=Streptomyces edwardsiae TaxID=3075527 RepID=A0ABU2QI61_9ACTN|nr:hypothetical protein [Streptomyces sp. DSM 41635]MDT0404156.1 hypothetical protein [Streptomyces sp. DSM 41635]
MSTSVDAERAWQDLQRIRVPQERVYDEVERSASGGPGATYATAASMWIFLAGLGLEPPTWGVWVAVVVYAVLLVGLVAFLNRGNRVRLHHSRYDWRTSVTFLGGMVVTGGTVLLSGRLAESLTGEPMAVGLIQATVTSGVFVLCVGPANRWAVGSLRAGR